MEASLGLGEGASATLLGSRLSKLTATTDVPIDTRDSEPIFLAVEKLVHCATAAGRKGHFRRATSTLQRAFDVAAVKASAGLLAGRVACAAVTLHYCALLSRFGRHTQALEEALAAHAELEAVFSAVAAMGQLRDAAQRNRELMRPGQGFDMLLRAPPRWIQRAVVVMVQAKHCVATELEWKLSAEPTSDHRVEHGHLQAESMWELIPQFHQEGVALAAQLLPPSHSTCAMSRRLEIQAGQRLGCGADLAGTTTSKGGEAAIARGASRSGDSKRPSTGGSDAKRPDTANTDQNRRSVSFEQKRPGTAPRSELTEARLRDLMVSTSDTGRPAAPQTRASVGFLKEPPQSLQSMPQQEEERAWNEGQAPVQPGPASGFQTPPEERISGRGPELVEGVAAAILSAPADAGAGPRRTAAGRGTTVATVPLQPLQMPDKLLQSPASSNRGRKAPVMLFQPAAPKKVDIFAEWLKNQDGLPNNRATIVQKKLSTEDGTKGLQEDMRRESKALFLTLKDIDFLAQMPEPQKKKLPKDTPQQAVTVKGKRVHPAREARKLQDRLQQSWSTFEGPDSSPAASERR